MIKARTAKFQIGQIVRHRVFSFRGVIFDIDPVFNNTEEWWLSIPEEVRPAQGPAVLPSARREFGVRIRRLCLRAEPAARQFRRADPPFAGRRDLRQGQVGRLSPAQSVAELDIVPRLREQSSTQKKAPDRAPFSFVVALPCLLRSRIGRRAPAGGLASSFLRASSARFCSSSCSFFWFSSNTFGSVGGPS